MFSIIVPLYNKGARVKRAIDSILSQNYEEFEIIVIDDGSNDDGSVYVKRYKDNRVKYFYKENGGVSSARNCGIDRSIGDWIIFLDADDEMLPGTLNVYKRQIEQYPEAKMHVTRQNNKYEGLGTLQMILQRLWGDNHCKSAPFCSHWLRLFFPCPGTVCISKKHIAAKGYFDQRISFYEDTEFMLRMMKDSVVSYTSHFALKYNQEDSGLSGSLHPIEKEMAYYIPEQIATASFWHKALLYENLELEIIWWQYHGNEEYVCFYQDMQKKYFGRIYKMLHWIRQQMVRHALI